MPVWDDTEAETGTGAAGAKQKHKKKGKKGGGAGANGTTEPKEQHAEEAQPNDPPAHDAAVEDASPAATNGRAHQSEPAGDEPADLGSAVKEVASSPPPLTVAAAEEKGKPDEEGAAGNATEEAAGISGGSAAVEAPAPASTAVEAPAPATTAVEAPAPASTAQSPGKAPESPVAKESSYPAGDEALHNSGLVTVGWLWCVRVPVSLVAFAILGAQEKENLSTTPFLHHPPPHCLQEMRKKMAEHLPIFATPAVLKPPPATAKPVPSSASFVKVASPQHSPAVPLKSPRVGRLTHALTA